MGDSSPLWETTYGYRSVRAEISVHILRARRLVLFLGVVAMRAMPTDIFPEIRIPVVSVIWRYTGLSTPEMEQRVTTYSQYSISANVNGIKDIEAQSMNGLSVQKIYFQPDVNLDLAIAQIVAATNAIRALMPPGIQPPVVVQFNASSVPVLQISLSSDTLNEQELYDYGIYRMRQQVGPDRGHHAADSCRGQVSPDHGRHRSREAGGQGPDPTGCRQRGQCAKSDAAVGHGEDRRQAIYRSHQCDAREHRRSQQHPDQGRQRRHGVRERRRPGARRLAGSAEHRAPGWPALGPAEHHQEWQCVHARGRQCRSGGAEDGARRRACGPPDQ